VRTVRESTYLPLPESRTEKGPGRFSATTLRKWATEYMLV
jgi:hypothetical protein